MPEERRADILDYLYEELPPEQMAAAREDIQADPNSLEEMRAVKDVVLAYRALPRPVPPAGLAARVAAAAAANNSPTVPTGVSVAPADAVGDEAEFELPVRRKRSWLFHPGWTVAAGVILVFAVLFHVSPRRTTGSTQPAPAATSGMSSKAIPAGSATPAAPAAAPRTKTSPTKREAAEPLPEVGQQRDETSQAGPPHPASLSMADTLVSEEPVNAPPSAAGIAPPPRDDLEAVLSASPPEPLPAPAMPLPDRYDATGLAAPSPGAAYMLQAAPAAAPEEAAGAGEVRAQSRLDGALDATPEEILEAAGDTAGEEVRIVDLLRGREPPPLIELGEPIDKEAIVQNLVFLIGLHMGEKEFPEARAAIELLRRYDPIKAGELAIALLKMEDAAEQTGEASAALGDTSPASAPAGSVTPSQAASPMPSPEIAIPAAEPQPVESPAAAPPDAESADPVDATPPAESTSQIIPAPEPAISSPVATEEIVLEASPPIPADPPGIMGPSIPWPPPLVLHSPPPPVAPSPTAPPLSAQPPQPPRQTAPQPASGRQQPPRLLWEDHR